MTTSPSPEAGTAAPGEALTREELAAWLALLETPGVGRGTARKLLVAFGGPQAVVGAGASALRAHVGSEVAAALADAPARLEPLVQTTWQWLRADATHHVVTLADRDYPPALLESGDPPMLLYGCGRLDALQRTSIAVVGSRSPSAAGAEHARDFCAAFAQAGLVVVSGMALGIDAAAHEGALRDAGEPAARTVAVLGTGVDRVYPKRHRELAHRIVSHGLLLSEFPLGTPPLPPHFPQRNRIIAGLARGTLVVEAALQSGSLITARMASDMGRDVFAIPGSIHSPLARGAHSLIKQGSKLVETVQDVFDEWQLGVRPAPPATTRRPSAPAADAAPALAPPASPQFEMPMKAPAMAQAAPAEPEALEPDTDPGEGGLSGFPRGRLEPVLAALGHDPVTLDELLDRTGLDIGLLSAYLLELELAGQVERRPGQTFQRTAVA